MKINLPRSQHPHVTRINWPGDLATDTTDIEAESCTARRPTIYGDYVNGAVNSNM